MRASFYTAATGAGTHQSKLDVISNNMANINTDGYKSKSAVFADLIYNNINQAQQSASLKSGTGTKIEATDIDFQKATTFRPEIRSTLRSQEKDILQCRILRHRRYSIRETAALQCLSHMILTEKHLTS